MASNEKVAFCQVDAHLDTNPKIRKAGRNGREVFLFVLRRVAIARTEGEISIRFIDPDYLADQLMVTASDASDGVLRAVTACLLECNETVGVVKVVGWSKEWGYVAKSGAERQAKYRSGKSAKSNDGVTASDASDGSPSRVTAGDESDGIDQRRIEKKEKGPAQPALTLGEFKAKVDRESAKAADEAPPRREPKTHPNRQAVIAAFDSRFKAATGTAPTWDGKTLKLADDLAKKHPVAELERRMDRMFAGAVKWLEPPYTLATFTTNLDSFVGAATPPAQRPMQIPLAGSQRPKENA